MTKHEDKTLVLLSFACMVLAFIFRGVAKHFIIAAAVFQFIHLFIPKLDYLIARGWLAFAEKLGAIGLQRRAGIRVVSIFKTRRYTCAALDGNFKPRIYELLDALRYQCRAQLSRPGFLGHPNEHVIPPIGVGQQFAPFC